MGLGLELTNLTTLFYHTKILTGLVYGDVHKILPDDMPEPLHEAVVTTTTMDANLNHCWVVCDLGLGIYFVMFCIDSKNIYKGIDPSRILVCKICRIFQQYPEIAHEPKQAGEECTDGVLSRSIILR